MKQLNFEFNFIVSFVFLTTSENFPLKSTQRGQTREQRTQILRDHFGSDFRMDQLEYKEMAREAVDCDPLSMMESPVEIRTTKTKIIETETKNGYFTALHDEKNGHTAFFYLHPQGIRVSLFLRYWS